MPSRLQEKPIVAPDLGLISGSPRQAVPSRGWFSVKNSRFQRGKTLKVSGFEKVQTGALADQVTGIFEYRKTTGYSAWIVTTLTKIYKKTGTDATFVDITGTALSANVDDWADFAVFRDLLIITNGKDTVRKWDGIAATTSNLAGSPPKARRVCVFQNHVVLSHIDPYGTPATQKIQWSDLGDAEVWVGGEAGSLSFLDEPTPILDSVPLRDSLIVYKEDAGYLIDYAGFPFTMTSRRLFTGVGPIASRVIIDVRDAHYWLSTDNHVYKSTLSGPEPIGQAVRVEIFDNLNYEQKGRAFGFLHNPANEIYFVVPTGASLFPNKAYICAYLEDKWGSRDLSATAASEKGVRRLNVLTWDSVTSAWDAQTVVWDGSTLQIGADMILHGNSSGFVFQHTAGVLDADGVAIDFDIESGMDAYDQPGKKKRVMALHLQYEQASSTVLTVHILHAKEPGLTPISSAAITVTLDGSGDQWVDVTDAGTGGITDVWFAYRFRNANSNQPVTLTGYTPAYYIREMT